MGSVMLCGVTGNQRGFTLDHPCFVGDDADDGTGALPRYGHDCFMHLGIYFCLEGVLQTESMGCLAVNVAVLGVDANPVHS